MIIYILVKAAFLFSQGRTIIIGHTKYLYLDNKGLQEFSWNREMCALSSQLKVKEHNVLGMAYLLPTTTQNRSVIKIGFI